MMCVCRTFGVKGDEAVTQRPLVHGLVEDDILWEDDHRDVLESAQPLQDLGHRLRLGLLHHAADPHHDLSLRGLEGAGERKANVTWFLCFFVCVTRSQNLDITLIPRCCQSFTHIKTDVFHC